MSVSNNELCNLAYEGKTALFTMRREASPDLIQLKDNSGRTPLHWAAAARQVDIGIGSDLEIYFIEVFERACV